MRYMLRAACGFLALGMPLSGLCAEPASENRPNIIFILTDDQGYGDLERHGHPLLKTPHTNRLYDESVRFDNFYVSPSCSPTRAALLTGMHEFRNGMTHTREPREHLYHAGMRGCKCTVWEGGTRAISFWRWPTHWKPHQVDNLTAHLDVLPTLCEVAGVQIPEALQSELEGFSLVPLLEAEQPLSWHDDRYLFHHVARWPSGLAASHKYAMCGIRQGNYLLLRSRPCDDPACTIAVLGNQCATLREAETRG